MIKISVNKKKISAEQIVAVNQFSNDLLENIRYLLKEQEFNHLKLLPLFELTPRDVNVVKISDNSSIALKSSIELVNKIRNIVKEYEELDVIIPLFTLNIKLVIKEKEMHENGQTSKITEEQLPNFTTTKPRYSFKEIILPKSVKRRIISALDIVVKQELVYKKWGFEEVDKVPRSILNFYGKPGTGKTMCAHAIADYLGRPLLACNYSEIESKYVGDAPKNLKHAFDTARENNAVLFFDEADSFLGKRIQNVSQGAEQALNSLRSQMLILLEEFEGVVLFATNLVSNFDKAFESRILDNIEIPLPDLTGRARIIKKMIPSKLPIKKECSPRELIEASEIIDGLAGREIKNAILKMLLSNAEDPDYKFDISDVKHALREKMKEKEALRNEENRILEEKIAKALKEKSVMANIENESTRTK